MSERMRRVNSIVREVLADEVELLKDPRLELITITGVETAPNLRNATVYFSTVDLDRAEEVREALEAAAPRLRRALGRQVRMKYTPRLEFALDTGVAGGARIDEILRRLHTPTQEEE
jgi:ribosome-binding factor A